MNGHVRVTDLDFVAELVRGQRDHLELYLLVALLVLAFDVGSASAIQSVSAARSLSIIMLRRRFSSNSLLVIGGCCCASNCSYRCSPMNRPFSCSAGNGEDLLRELFVAHADALALGLRQRRLFVDHLLQDLLVDAELPQQLLVDAAAILLLVGLDLSLVTSLEIAALDVLAVDRRRPHRMPTRRPTVDVVSRKLGM